MYHDQLKEFAGKPVVYYKADQPVDLSANVYRIHWDWDSEQELAESTKLFLASDGIEQVEAIVFGAYGEYDDLPGDAIDVLIENRDKLPRLRSVFFGDSLYEEAMISSLFNSDMTAFFEAFPALEYVHIRGGSIAFKPFRHVALRKLVLESGGLSGSVLTNLSQCVLPELEHLEIWTGDPNYGAEVKASQIEPFLREGLFPKLTSLGIRNCAIIDELAPSIASASVLSQIDTLDLSGGTLSDVGATALVDAEGILGLKRLDLHRHFMSEEMCQRLEQLASVEVDVSDREPNEEYGRYVAVGE